MTHEKIHIRPLNVPWMVLPSVPELKMVCQENDTTTVEFYVQCLGNQARVRMSFFRVSSALLGCMDDQGLPSDIFERWPAPERPVDVRAYLRGIKEKWAASGVCPEPGIYEVVETNPEVPYGYVIAGHDSYAHIQCRGEPRWEYVVEPGSLHFSSD